MSKEFENLLARYWDLAYLEGKSGVSQGDKANEVLHAMKKLAEQPAPATELREQEPVATLWQHGRTGRTRITMPGDITDCDADWFKAADLYTSPPAQRTWVGLTIEERKRAIQFNNAHEALAIVIEAKLREKNT